MFAIETEDLQIAISVDLLSLLMEVSKNMRGEVFVRHNNVGILNNFDYNH
ncbi:hypothetical protein KSX_59360 [Ktedonospora formicarum]|uniref:Uncharacterized protein n=1 Tax=Ktedonospora formicarum TaxID=2778364 RepID=A0A8J3MVK8_9CHLR|nr:hypothetical protein KSX_59360 [Ktedonospora formicarum]